MVNLSCGGDAMGKINGLDLFSGIGGIGVALSPWVRVVAYCERDPYAQSVLLSRMQSGDIDCAPIWDDVQTLQGVHLPPIDIIFGGFPCQDLSVAGAGAGLAGERSGLVFEIFRLARECRPRFIFLENVPALAVRGLDRVLLGLDALGYDARWTIVSAAEVGAPHLRERIWILAHANDARLERLERNEVARQELRFAANLVLPEIWPEDLNKYCRENDGIRRPVDRIRAIGNAVVPLATRIALTRLMGILMKIQGERKEVIP